MSIDKLVNALVSLVLIETMINLGLGVTARHVLDVAKNWRYVVKAALANYLLVPALAVALLLMFRAQPMVAAGFLIVAVCPGATYGPPLTALARGNPAVAVGLMVILAGSSALAAPPLLYALLPIVAPDAPLRVNASKMVFTLLVTQFLPLLAGMMVHHFRPDLATKWKGTANKLTAILNLLVLGFILVVQFQTLAQLPLKGFIGMLLLLSSTTIVGWLLGGPGREFRIAMALATSVRNVGVGLVIATSSFSGTAAVTAALTYGLFQTVVMVFVALGWGRLASPGVGVGPL
jgi:BASS family bile acid:Na+ symporter